MASLRLPFEMLSDIGLSLAERLNLPTFEAGRMTLYKQRRDRARMAFVLERVVY